MKSPRVFALKFFTLDPVNPVWAQVDSFFVGIPLRLSVCFYAFFRPDFDFYWTACSAILLSCVWSWLSGVNWKQTLRASVQLVAFYALLRLLRFWWIFFTRIESAQAWRKWEQQ